MDNIKNINNVDPNTLEFQEYQESDNALISSFDINDIYFTENVNSIEYHIFDSNKNLIYSEYNFTKYSLIDNSLVIDKLKNLTSYGFDEGQYYTLYNFINPLFNSTSDSKFYISEISSDRTELRLSSNIISASTLRESYNNFISSSNNVQYYKDFYLNFGDNNLVIANNILLDNGTLLIKLYEPLDIQFDIKNELWIVEKLAESIAYFIELITVLDETENTIKLKGPNLNISVKDRINNSTGYVNFDTLNNSPSSSLTNQLNSILSKNEIRLNIDHSDYSNFIHFSSAETRLENFVYKLSLIEEYNQQSLSSSFSSTNYYLTESKNLYQNKITDIITNFDTYEYYLYFNSGSTSWPKSNSVLPYENYSSTSSQGLNWLTGQLLSASLYDVENKDNLINSIPSYLKDDPRNLPYELYVKMLGQHFDTLYLYTEELNKKYNSDNRVNYGMSKDLISDALKDFGIKIYQNNFSTNDLYSSFLGINQSLGLLPPTGSELISTYVTASSEVIPLEDVNNEIYKRLYHNLPLLLKKKGTISGLKLLLNIYGVPDTILRVNQFGGKNKKELNDWDQFQNQYNFSFYTTSSGFIKYDVPATSSLSESLSTVEFRFKTTGIPTKNVSQSLAHFTPDYNFNIVLEYSGSGNVSSSYSSSVVDPYNEYGTLKFIDSSNRSASIYLPFFDGEWWSLMVNINQSAPFTSSIYVKNKIYNGYDGNTLGFQASASVSSSYWVPISQSFYLSHSGSKIIAGKTYLPFSGSFQELRFYKTALSESIFNDYVMNPRSIGGNQLKGDNSLNSLIFRAPLGSVLENNTSSSRISIHPSINSYPITYSFFTSQSSVYTLSGSYSFIPNNEVYYYNQFPAGIKNIISNKININNNILPEGDVLSSQISIQQKYQISESYTRDVNYIEVGFSPQNEINEDIISQLGNFNIGDYIGDPRQLVNKNTNQYVDFNQLRDEYFKKYNRPFNLGDYIRLIKYFDNSLFKLIKDFTPARASLATGVIIKQHLLERNRYSPAQTSFEPEDYSGSIKSYPFNYSSSILYKVLGGNGGMMPNITQSYIESFKGPTGISLITKNDNIEFLNGEFSGSILTATTQSLTNNPFLNVNIPFTEYKLKFYFNTAVVDEYNFLNYIVPFNGQILFYPNYIKISKYDQNGNLNNNLNNLNNFTVQFSDKTTVTYIINSRTEHSSHFVYNIIENTNGLTTDGEVLEYKVSASFTGLVSHSVGPTALPVKSIPLTNIFTDVRGYLTGSYNNFNDIAGMVGITSSFYTLQDYPNIVLSFSMSVRFQTTTPTHQPYIKLCRTYNPVSDLRGFATSLPAEVEVVHTVTAGAPIPTPITLNLDKNVFDNLSGYSYFVVFGSNVINSSTSASQFSLQITQSVSPQTATTNLITFNPVLIQKFEGGDYDALYGNVDQIQGSQYFKRIDYIDYNISTPYFNQILSGTAYPSYVKDYYYILKRHTYPRYIGSRNTSDDFNSISIITSSIIQNQQNIYLGPSSQEGVAYNYNTAIYEFEKIYKPIEISFLNLIKLNQIINVDVTSSVDIIKPNYSNFGFIKQNIKPGDYLDCNYYSPTNLSNKLKVKTPMISPKISAIILRPSGSQGIFTSNIARLSTNFNSFQSVILNSASQYEAGPRSKGNLDDMITSIQGGKEWYVSIFSGSLNFPIDVSNIDNDTVRPMSGGLIINSEPITDYLAASGIFRIYSQSYNGSNSDFHCKIPTAAGVFSISFFTVSASALFWENNPNGNGIILDNVGISDSPQGNFVLSNSTPLIQNNIDYITQTYGNNPKN